MQLFVTYACEIQTLTKICGEMLTVFKRSVYNLEYQKQNNVTVDVLEIHGVRNWQVAVRDRDSQRQKVKVKAK